MYYTVGILNKYFIIVKYLYIECVSILPMSVHFTHFLLYIIKWCPTRDTTCGLSITASHSRLRLNETFDFKRHLFLMPLTAGATHSSATDVPLQLCFLHVSENQFRARAVSMAPRAAPRIPVPVCVQLSVSVRTRVLAGERGAHRAWQSLRATNELVEARQSAALPWSSPSRRHIPGRSVSFPRSASTECANVRELVA